MSAVNFDELVGDSGVFDVACPICGPDRRSAGNRVRKVLRVWRPDPGFATWHCARCGESGHSRDPEAAPRNPAAIAAAQRAAAERARVTRAERLKLARWLWSRRRPIKGSPAERYLREARGIACTLPATLGYLPARDEHPHAMIAAFGIPSEPEPGVLAIGADGVRAVHLTKLAPDGRGKAAVDKPKVVLASPIGSPIALAPPNDLLGLAITEGVEDALSVHQATGLGVWAAGSAGFIPALADVVPAYVEVHVMVDDNPNGRRNSAELVRRLRARGFAVVPHLLRSEVAA